MLPISISFVVRKVNQVVSDHYEVYEGRRPGGYLGEVVVWVALLQHAGVY